jgi:hypothetical protein
MSSSSSRRPSDHEIRSEHNWPGRHGVGRTIQFRESPNLGLRPVGEILIAFASFLFAMTRDPDGWNGLTMRELAVRSLLAGGSVGASLGLLVAALTRPSGTRLSQLILLGAVGGLLAGLAYGVMALEDACGPGFIDPGPCGWVFVGLLFRRPWMPIALWTVFGGVLGAMFAWIAARLIEEKGAASRASGGLA